MGDVQIDLFRACKKSAWSRNQSQIADRFTNDGGNGAGSLYPDYDGFMRKNGTFRAPDVTSFTDGNGQVWIGGVNDTESRFRDTLI